MTTQVTVHNPQQAQIIEKVIINGDLAELSSAERVSYYREVCASLGLNPLTRPFEYLKLNGKLVLYARKECTDQIRNNWNVSIAITAREKIEDLYIVTARATMPDGRTDESTGVVTIAGLKADLLANACMKAETKSKRRATLSICGLGVLDETEVDTIAGARRVVVAATGEIIDSPPRPQLAVSNPSPESVAPVLPLKDAERQAPIPTAQSTNGTLPNPWPVIPEFKHKGEFYGWAQNHLNLSQAKVNETLGIKTPMELTGDLKEAAERIREHHGVRPPMTVSDEIPVNEPPVDDF